MHVALDSRQMELLADVQRALLSPLEGNTLEDWQRRTHAALRRLLHADHILFYMPHGEDLCLYSEDLLPATLDGLLRFVSGYEPGLILSSDPQINAANRIRRRRGAGVYHESELFGRGGKRKSPCYREVLEPAGLRHMMGLSVPLPHGEAGLVLGFEQPDAPHFSDVGLGRLRLLLPDFIMGVRAYVQFFAGRARFFTTLDTLSHAVFVYADGQEIYCNRSCRELLSLEEERALVCATAHALAHRLYAHRPIHATGNGSGDAGLSENTQCLQSPRTQYLLCASYLPAGLLPSPGVLVAVSKQSLSPPSLKQIRSQFELTRRESQVAALITRGLSSKEIADRLCISKHTVRHHTEHLMQKLGLHTRTALVAKILEAA
jgi:DNA-binding CsgD family transcriptional regulator/PAS domain-containing protein